MKQKQKVILDIIIKLNDDEINPELIKSEFEVYSTIAQLSEFKADKNKERQNDRLKYYETLSPISLNLESGALVDILVLDYDTPLTDRVGEIFENIKGNSNKTNTWIDALIAEVAKENHLILVTNDDRTANRAIENSIKVMDYFELINRIKK